MYTKNNRSLQSASRRKGQTPKNCSRVLNESSTYSNTIYNTSAQKKNMRSKQYRITEEIYDDDDMERTPHKIESV